MKEKITIEDHEFHIQQLKSLKQTDLVKESLERSRYEISYLKNEAIGPLSKDQLKQLRQELITLITEKHPSDIGFGNDHEWFCRDSRNQVCWNFRNKQHALQRLCEQKKLLRQFSNTSPRERYRLMESILNSAAVKKVKQRTA